MNNHIPYMISNDGNVESMTLFLSGVPRAINTTHPSYVEIKSNIATLSVQEVRELLDIKKAVQKQLKRYGNITVHDNKVTYKGEEVHSLLADRMMQMLEEGYNIAPWALFMENLMQNPAKHAVDELYLWLERSKMPITERGNFLAYKKVQNDYTSYHRNKDGSVFRNDIGTLCQMPRNQVDDNRSRTCSSGLHFCSWDYLPSYYGSSGKVLLVEVNPAHVVSIPSDYNNAKGRAEAYLVVGEIPQRECEHAFQCPVVSYHDSDWITWQQEDDIDYSSIDDGWYNDYEEDDEAAEADRAHAYEEGYEYGQSVYNSDEDFDVDAEFERLFADEDLFESFEEGWADGYFNASIENGEDPCDPEEKEEDPNEDLTLQAVFNVGFIDGESDYHNGSMMDIMSASYATLAYQVEYQKGYIEGYQNARNLAEKPCTAGADQLRKEYRSQYW